jgi:nucleoside-diphosphate-sugar epimerase
VTVELSDTYGADDRRSKVLQLLVEAHRTQQPVGLSPGEQVVDLVHVDDVVDALLRAVPLADAQARSYAVHGDPVVLRDFVALVGDVLGSAVPVEWGARAYRPREMMQPWRHWPRLPGWRPTIALREGLTALLQDDPHTR